jgi:uncharacterized protein (TIGR02996 family)
MLAERDALYQAILANPDDDAPRLVYADWLEEHGDALPQGREAALGYAQFIRAQVRLAKAPPYDPRWVQAWGAELQYRHRKAGGRWHKLFAPRLPRGVTWWHEPFDRGFPASVRVRAAAAFAKHAETLFALGPVQSLYVWADFSELSELAPLADSPHLRRLRRLEFSFSELSAADIGRLQASPHADGLRELEFEYHGITTEGMRALFRPPLITQIESLRIYACEQIPSTGWKKVGELPGPHRLRKLVLAETAGVPAGLFRLPLFHGLVELHLQGCPFTPVRDLLRSPGLPVLESLTLTNTAPGLDGVRALAGCEQLCNLRHLSLMTNNIGPVGARVLARSALLAKVQLLDLHNNPLGDKGARALAGSPHLGNLEQLNLGDCQVGDAGALALLDSPNTAKLIRLNLRTTPEVCVSDRVKRKLRQRFGDRVTV